MKRIFAVVCAMKPGFLLKRRRELYPKREKNRSGKHPMEDFRIIADLPLPVRHELPNEPVTRLCDRCGKYEFFHFMSTEDDCIVKWGLECVWTNKYIEKKLAGLSLHGGVWLYEPRVEMPDDDDEEVPKEDPKEEPKPTLQAASGHTEPYRCHFYDKATTQAEKVPKEEPKEEPKPTTQAAPVHTDCRPHRPLSPYHNETGVHVSHHTPVGIWPPYPSGS